MEKTYEQLLNDIFVATINNGASDIHMTAGRKPYMRVQGELSEMLTFPEFTDDMIAGVLKLMVDQDQIKNLVEHIEIDFAYQYQDKLRLRGNAAISGGRIGIVLRTISQIRTFAELGLPEELANFTRAKQGFFLVVGPVGQGKSTTLAGMIDVINTSRKDHIVTIEHPIEYVHVEKQSIIDQLKLMRYMDFMI
jgi:twitching motility protein PilT